MSGRDFERQVLNLLQSRGFVAEMTEATADGGIDIVAKRTGALLAGKYVVQCKNWTRPVGEPTVRDLYGVVMAENANKGILVTTSRFTSAARAFAEGKPLELIDGSDWKRLISHIDSSQVRDVRDTELPEETLSTFTLMEDLSARMKRFLADLDSTHDHPPPPALVGNELLDEPYHYFLIRTLRDSHEISQDVIHHLERWMRFVRTTDWTTPHEEAADEFAYYIQRWEYLLERLLSMYKDVHRIPPPPELANAHMLALTGIYHLASAFGFALWKCERQYDEIEDKITLVIESEQALFDYHSDEGFALLARAAEEFTAATAKPKQRKSWWQRLIGH